MVKNGNFTFLLLEFILADLPPPDRPRWGVLHERPFTREGNYLVLCCYKHKMRPMWTGVCLIVYWELLVEYFKWLHNHPCIHTQECTRPFRRYVFWLQLHYFATCRIFFYDEDVCNLNTSTISLWCINLSVKKVQYRRPEPNYLWSSWSSADVEEACIYSLVVTGQNWSETVGQGLRR